MHRALSLLTFIVLACSSGAPRSVPQTRADPKVMVQADQARAFVDRMLDALERQDPDAWWELLSRRMRQRLGNPASAHEQLTTWRREVLPIAPMLRRAKVVIDPTGPQLFLTYTADGGTPEALAMVVAEDGVLRLDEN